MPETHHAVKPSLSFAKLVATPTELSWSQVYNAGNLFACLSLKCEEPKEELPLHSLGKECLSILESEFFVLEEKNTQSIKDAIATSLAKVPEEVVAELIVAFFKDNVLTVFIAGSGKSVLKRGEKIGVLLEKYGPYENGEISSASGYVQNNDTVVMQTGDFAQGIPEETVSSALDLDLPNDIVEALSPQVLEQNNGSQAAIVITFHGAGPQHVISHDLAEPEDDTIASLYNSANVEQEPLVQHEHRVDEGDEQEEEPTQGRRKLMPALPHIAIPHMPQIKMHLSHRRKLYLTIAVILMVLLAVSIFMSVKKQSDEKQQEVFTNIYKPAEQYYEEGQGLESLNKSLSHDSYLKAESKLKEADGKIDKNSSEGKQIADLLAKIEAALQNTPAQDNTNAQETSAPENSLLAVEKANADGLGFGQDENSIAIITDKTVKLVSKSNGSKRDTIKNDSDWSSPQAVVPYQGNTYILDQKEGVIKFVGATKSSYFQGDSPDLSKATGMAIDGSIWIVEKDGKVLKYTRGKADSFSISGLDKPLSSPTKILTSLNMDSVYILDNGNNRIVQINKQGSFKKAYTASVISSAKDFDISIKDNSLLVLSGGKVYKIAL